MSCKPYFSIFILETLRAFFDLSITKQFLKFGEFTKQEMAMFELPVQTSIKTISSKFLLSFNTFFTIISVSFLGIKTLLSTKKSRE
ncbi:MAG: hypothetical protein LBU14_04600 [Candidatus Peribacteria bacterium]|nr:hypothetical protein [Candidatus Peribacteria bacterium]